MKVELTAPAGDLQKGKIAIEYGADSIYIGFPQFSLRSGAEKFALQELSDLTTYVHCLGKRIYYAMNIFAHNHHIPLFKEYLKIVGEMKPDGIIVSDPGLMSLAKKILPDISLCVSTQANTTNYETIKLWEKIGANRVVLARELSLEEIKEIRENINEKTELEVFVHGAVCMAYSGRCLLSAFMTAPEFQMTHHKYGSNKIRQANLGDCVQPCRFRYALVEENRKDLAFPIEEDEWGTYILSAKDLCMIDYLRDLYESGVNVFKIEGRMKSLYYVANVTRVYRRGIEKMLKQQPLEKEYRDELYNVSHRGYSTGFAFPEDRIQNAAYQGYQKNYILCALIEKAEQNIYSLKVFNAFSENDTIEIIDPDFQDIILKAGEFKLLDKNKNSTYILKNQFDGFIYTKKPLRENRIVRMSVE